MSNIMPKSSAKYVHPYSFTLLLLTSSLLPSVAFAESKGLDQIINDSFAPIANTFGGIVFHNFPGTQVPTVLILLVFGALFFTLYFRFVNLSKFFTAIAVVSGKHDKLEGEKTTSEHSGEVSHFQALATAVSGTVGLGNIAGVAKAIAIGGPGATFWMIVCGLLGMTTKLVECTLGVKYRDIGPDGTVYGGPMYYLSKGLSSRGFAGAGKILAVIFAILCVGGSFGGGNAAQSNQAALVIIDQFNIQNDSAGTIIGMIMACIVGFVILGGIKKIVSVTEKIVPFMAVIYVVACLIVIVSKFSYLGHAIGLIFANAFTPSAAVGGLVGVLIQGFQRGAFSNEAGTGSASIAHSAVNTKYPASEGLVSLLEPFIDTVVICTMTALVIIIYNSGGQFDYGASPVTIGGMQYEGATLTSKAFSSVISWFPSVLTLAIFLFAFSTMISWSYYGLQSWCYLFGKSKAADISYKLLFCVFIIIGAASEMGSVWDFSDAMILAMVFPNMIGLFFLFPQVKVELERYLGAIKKLK